MHLVCAVLLLASFDCMKATTEVEKTICASRRLFALDKELAATYAAARKRGGDALRDEQRRWLKETRDACDYDGCLEPVYLMRIATLRHLYPDLFAKQKPPSRILGRYSEMQEVCGPSEDDAEENDCEGEVENFIDIRRAEGNQLVVESELYFYAGHQCHIEKAPAEWVGGELRVVLPDWEGEKPGCVLLLTFADGQVQMIDHADYCREMACGARGSFFDFALPKKKP